MYETTDYAGNKIWHDMQLRMSVPVDSTEDYGLGVGITAEPGEKYGPPVTVRPRVGQSSFRLLVTEAYQRRCAITGEKTLVALEAAHICLIPVKAGIMCVMVSCFEQTFTDYLT